MESILHPSDNNHIAYQKLEGTGPGVVFLGGFMSDMQGEKARYLETCCRSWGRAYVRFDYFGHGGSSGDFKEATVSRWLEDVLLVLDTLTEGPQVLVGSSMGGWLMVRAALQRIDRIKALVGIAAAPDFVEDFSKLTRQHTEALRQNGICYLPASDGSRPYIITQKLITDATQHWVLRSPIALNCSVRLLHGLSDQAVSWKKSMLLAERLISEDVQVTLVKGGDHRLSSASNLALLGETVESLC